MKKKSFLSGAVAVIVLTVLFTACSKNPDMAGDDLVIQGNGARLNSDAGNDCNFNAVLTDEEIAGLMHMREEEKVARDVYLKFYEIYGNVIFENIAASEQKHMEAVLALIDGYLLIDPVAGLGVGVFTEKFQEIYNSLIARGTTLAEAFKVGVDIEKLDIEDLTKYLSSTEVPNLIKVYNKLLSASEKHLETFTSLL